MALCSSLTLSFFFGTSFLKSLLMKFLNPHSMLFKYMSIVRFSKNQPGPTLILRCQLSFCGTRSISCYNLQLPDLFSSSFSLAHSSIFPYYPFGCQCLRIAHGKLSSGIQNQRAGCLQLPVVTVQLSKLPSLRFITVEDY